MKPALPEEVLRSHGYQLMWRSQKGKKIVELPSWDQSTLGETETDLGRKLMQEIEADSISLGH